MRLVIAAIGALSVFPAFSAGPVIYACAWADQNAKLNLTTHRVQIAGIETELNEGALFNFRSPGGPVILDLGDPDRLHFERPEKITGTVEPNTPVTCTRAS